MSIKSMNGARGWGCYQAYVNFIFYINFADTYKGDNFKAKTEMLDHFKSADEDEKRKIICEIMKIRPISPDDMMKFVSVHQLNNGAFVTPSTINNFDIKQMAEMVFESIVACSDVSDEVFF